MNTICLSMIVRNEANVVERCLTSVRSFINAWQIVDTGSTDDTKVIIQKSLDDIPGELHDRPWQDFGTNRTEALNLAKTKADYSLIIDADDVLVPNKNFVMPKLTKEAYELKVKIGAEFHYRMHLFRNDINFRYEGVLHEVAVCDQSFTPGRINGLIYDCIGGGGRSSVSKQEKFRNDAKVLENALKKEPNNARYAHYFAQSLKDADDFELAIAAYERSVEMHTSSEGYFEEAVIGLLEIARIKQQIQSPEPEVVAAYTRAFERCPDRIEPLYELAVYFRKKKRHAAAFLYAKACLGVPKPVNAIFVKDAIYEWGAIDEFASNAFMIGEFHNATAGYRSLLSNPKLPVEERDRVLKNFDRCRIMSLQK